MFGIFKQIKELSKYLPKALLYARAVKVVIYHANLAKQEIHTLFDDIEGNEPSYLDKEDEK